MPNRDFNCSLCNLIEVKVRYTLLNIILISKTTDNNNFENILLGIKILDPFWRAAIDTELRELFKDVWKVRSEKKLAELLKNSH